MLTNQYDIGSLSTESFLSDIFRLSFWQLSWLGQICVQGIIAPFMYECLHLFVCLPIQEVNFSPYVQSPLWWAMTPPRSAFSLPCICFLFSLLHITFLHSPFSPARYRFLLKKPLLLGACVFHPLQESPVILLRTHGLYLPLFERYFCWISSHSSHLFSSWLLSSVFFHHVAALHFLLFLFPWFPTRAFKHLLLPGPLLSQSLHTSSG